jgi:hypothetical protein
MASSKGFTRPLQAWTTVCGSGSDFRDMVLPVEGWLDVGDYEHLFVSVEVSKLYAGPAVPISLIIESSHTLPGFTTGSEAWFVPVGAVTAPTVGPAMFNASRERPNSTSTTTFTKYLRWRISAPSATAWTATFKVCVNAQ